MSVLVEAVDRARAVEDEGEEVLVALGLVAGWRAASAGSGTGSPKRARGRGAGGRPGRTPPGSAGALLRRLAEADERRLRRPTRTAAPPSSAGSATAPPGPEVETHRRRLVGEAIELASSSSRAGRRNAGASGGPPRARPRARRSRRRCRPRSRMKPGCGCARRRAGAGSSRSRRRAARAAWFWRGEDRQDLVGLAQGRVGAADDRVQVLPAARRGRRPGC